MKGTEWFKRLAGDIQKATAGVTSSIQDMRAKIAALQEQSTREARAYLPRVEIEARIAEEIQDAGRAWLKDHNRIVLRKLGNPDRCEAPLRWNAEVPWGLLCAAQPQFAAALLSGVIDLAPYEPGSPSAERPRLVARIERELAEAEKAEEAAIDEAIAAGIVVEHRPEVVARRERERAERERAEAAAADALARQHDIDARMPRSRVSHSQYLKEARGHR